MSLQFFLTYLNLLVLCAVLSYFVIFVAELKIDFNGMLLGAFRQSSETSLERINTWKENGGAHGNNAYESHKLIIRHVLWLMILKAALITVR